MLCFAIISWVIRSYAVFGNNGSFGTIMKHIMGQFLYFVIMGLFVPI